MIFAKLYKILIKYRKKKKKVIFFDIYIKSKTYFF